MAYSVSKVDIWSGDIDDRVGGLAAKLDPLPDDAGWFQITLNPDIEGRHDSSAMVD
jgi:hypothetical protein